MRSWRLPLVFALALVGCKARQQDPTEKLPPGAVPVASTTVNAAPEREAPAAAASGSPT